MEGSHQGCELPPFEWGVPQKGFSFQYLLMSQHHIPSLTLAPVPKAASICEHPVNLKIHNPKVDNYVEDNTEDIAWGTVSWIALRGCTEEEKEEPGHTGVFAGKHENKNKPGSQTL